MGQGFLFSGLCPDEFAEGVDWTPFSSFEGSVLAVELYTLMRTDVPWSDGLWNVEGGAWSTFDDQEWTD